jgi:hypothetical protein
MPPHLASPVLLAAVLESASVREMAFAPKAVVRETSMPAVSTVVGMMPVPTEAAAMREVPVPAGLAVMISVAAVMPVPSVMRDVSAVPVPAFVREVPRTAGATGVCVSAEGTGPAALRPGSARRSAAVEGRAAALRSARHVVAVARAVFSVRGGAPLASPALVAASLFTSSGIAPFGAGTTASARPRGRPGRPGTAAAFGADVAGTFPAAVGAATFCRIGRIGSRQLGKHGGGLRRRHGVRRLLIGGGELNFVSHCHFDRPVRIGRLPIPIERNCRRAEKCPE